MKVAETGKLFRHKNIFTDTKYFAETWICRKNLHKLWDIPDNVQYIQLVGFNRPVKDSYKVQLPKQQYQTRRMYERDVTVVTTNGKKISYMLAAALRHKLELALVNSDTGNLYVKLYYWF